MKEVCDSSPVLATIISEIFYLLPPSCKNYLKQLLKIINQPTVSARSDHDIMGDSMEPLQAGSDLIIITSQSDQETNRHECYIANKLLLMDI